jgi:hypothetical protein
MKNKSWKNHRKKNGFDKELIMYEQIVRTLSIGWPLRLIVSSNPIIHYWKWVKGIPTYYLLLGSLQEVIPRENENKKMPGKPYDLESKL